MKATKKLFALVLALVMAMALSVSASAATITINGNNGETYTAYKVLDVTTTDSGDGYSYTTSNAKLFTYLTAAGFTVTNNGGLYYVTAPADDEDTADVDEWQDCADKLTAALAALSETELEDLLGYAAGEVTLNLDAEPVVNTITGLEAGYYFVTSSLGSLCMLNTAADTVTINEKNKEPTVDKKVDKTDAQIGDTVTYTVTIEVPANTESLKLTDTLSNGLTLNNTSFEIAIDNAEATDLTESNITTDNENGTTTFTVDLTGYLSQLTNGGTIVVTYTATINENAVSTNPATNKAEVSYGNSSSVSSTTTTKTTPLTIKKIDGTTDEELNGAEFTLQKKNGDAWEDVYVVPVYAADGETIESYRVATSSTESGATTTIVVNGSVTIEGLDVTAAYQLIETKAPDGYNLLTTPVEVTTSTTGEGETAVTVFEVTVENNSGSLLPSTGGMGTTVIYIVGALLVIGAGVVLVVRRRMSAE